MSPQIIVVSNKAQSEWLSSISEALIPLGDVHIMSENEVWEQIGKLYPSLMIIDAGAVDEEVTAYVDGLHTHCPNLPVVVVTTSPTWRRARAMFMAGASDYIRKSFDMKRIFTVCQDLLYHSLVLIAPIL